MHEKKLKLNKNIRLAFYAIIISIGLAIAIYTIYEDFH